MTDEELAQLIREVDAERVPLDLDELDAPLGADIAARIVDGHVGRRRSRVIPALGVLIAVAALLFLFLGRATVPTTYTLEATTGISDQRSVERALIATPTHPVRLLLRPGTRTSSAPTVTATVAGEPVPLVPTDRPGGAVELELGSLPAGQHRVELQVTPEGGEVQRFTIDVEARP